MAGDGVNEEEIAVAGLALSCPQIGDYNVLVGLGDDTNGSEVKFKLAVGHDTPVDNSSDDSITGDS